MIQRVIYYLTTSLANDGRIMRSWRSSSVLIATSSKKVPYAKCGLRLSSAVWSGATMSAKALAIPLPDFIEDTVSGQTE
ncbi:hypothetical protein DPMN_046600 [Dreissena polymorpha]|uniref:Uncharacterized protein n=1 Tax=Dreissena polymorpha TaxID=45954 RepID=A0A9D4D831_DREPO|nr:hypothetical protein DPMN_046600 [Dreissena polymorpha]